MTSSTPAVCKKCGAPTGAGDVVIRHSEGDPLQVTECARCGSIVRIGGHTW